ncbi:MAG TPA: hypothetical protein VEA99_06575 [Gemmatimonadaceae bacterium]|nr:hypothetical protein [Gemmatimonadaceae bacterium]
MSSATSATAARGSRAPADEPSRFRRLRLLPWPAIVLTALVLLAALFAIPPIRDAATGAAIDEGTLVLPSSYLVLAPLFDVMDTVTLFGVRQHVALLVTLIAGWVLLRAWPRARRGAAGDAATRPPLARRVGGELLRFALFLGAIVAFYAVMLLVPRPMARLVLSDLDVLAVDFHMHTQYSHDGRDGWTTDKVRRWGEKAGFDVLYISDHRTFEGVQEALPNSPRVAGQGVLLLPALEVVWRGERVNVLSAGTTYTGITDAALRDIDEDALRLASLIPGKEPVLVQTVPADLSKVVAPQGPGTPGIRAIEVIDGGPRGIGQTRRERARIVRLADSLNLALVAGSDNHGYGSTAPGWTLFRMPGWRSAVGSTMAEALERIIRLGGRSGTRVVERVVADPGNGIIALVFTAPVALWRLLTTLSVEQRLMWIIWVWALTLIGVTWRWGRARRTRAAAAR